MSNISSLVMTNACQWSSFSFILQLVCHFGNETSELMFQRLRFLALPARTYSCFFRACSDCNISEFIAHKLTVCEIGARSEITHK